MTLDIYDTSEPKPTKIPAKFHNPDDHSQTWTRQGIVPNWLNEFVEKDHDKIEFLIDNTQ